MGCGPQNPHIYPAIDKVKEKKKEPFQYVLTGSPLNGDCWEVAGSRQRGRRKGIGWEVIWVLFLSWENSGLERLVHQRQDTQKWPPPCELARKATVLETAHLRLH